MAQPSGALRQLHDAVSVLPSDTVLTAGRLVELIAEATRSQEAWEHDEYMGEDQ